MNCRSLAFPSILSAFICIVTCLELTSLVSPALAQSETNNAARKVFEENSPKIFGIKALVKFEASIQGKQAVNRERSVFGIGTVIDDGILLVSYRSIRPKATANVQGQARGIKIVTKVKEIKIVDESGEEFDAKLVLHDEDLDIAYVALDRDSENAESWSGQAVDISQDVELKHLDDVVILSRSGESMRFQPTVRIGQVNTIIPRPRTLYVAGSLVLSGATFNLDGQFIGLSIRKTSGSGGEFSAILPSKYIRKLLPQAIEKANSDDEETEDEESEDEASDEGDSDDESDDSNDESDETDADTEDDKDSKSAETEKDGTANADKG